MSTSRFVLPIKSTYVPEWGAWECLREIIQNAKDEEDKTGNPMQIEEHPVSHGGVSLIIRNVGSTLDRKALLIGHTDKSGSDLRGKFGEGLDLAFLAGTRAGIRMCVETQGDKWTPAIEYSEDFDAKCLVVYIERRSEVGQGVCISMHLPPDVDWPMLRRRFLFMSRIPDNRIARVPEKGAILLEPERKGHVYAKGIYVDNLTKLSYGYDLDRCELDRDRRMIDVFELQWRISDMYKEAVARRPELLIPVVYRMLRDGAEDVRMMQYHTSHPLSEGVAARFREDHGNNAFPVSSIAESAQLEHLGKRGVVVNEPLAEVLRYSIGDVRSVTEELSKKAVNTYAWPDLTKQEKASLIQFTRIVDEASSKVREVPPMMDRMEIVDFANPDIQGICDPDTGKIWISRKILSDNRELLKTLVHEEAHAVSGGGDGNKFHGDMVEDLWCTLFMSRFPM